MAVRSPNIYGRIKRVLKLRGLTEDIIQSQEIYDEMNEGQKQVMLRVPVEAERTISIVAGVQDYPLTISTREIYGSIVEFIRPPTWNYPIDFVFPNDWDRIVNNGIYDSYNNPVKATIFGKTLRLYPAPKDSDILTLFVRLKMPTKNLSATVEPETPEDFDAAIGDWALWKLLGESNFLESFLEQIQTGSNAKYYKGFSIQKAKVIW